MASSPKLPSASRPAASATVVPNRLRSVPDIASAVSPSLPKIDRRAQVRGMLLEGQWTSRGKPASLLPSDVTLCERVSSNITCSSVPRNIDTKYGEAVYKVEATLQDFSSDDSFRVSYRTLVRLLSSGGSDTDSADWQTTENAMSCRLVSPDKISCTGEGGVTREYDR